MDIFNLYAKLSLDKSDYERALGKAQAETKQTTNDIKSGFDGISTESKKAGKKVEKNFKESNDSVKVSFKGMTANAISSIMNIAEKAIGWMQKTVAQARNLVNYADRYSDISAKYDIGTQSLQELDYIAGQSGTDLESLMSTMTQLYNRAQSGSDVFDKLGVSVKDSNGEMKAMDTLFWEVKSALDTVENSGDKSALMLEAFGESAMSVGEVLRKDTDELVAMADKANRLGLILDEKTINSASNFNDLLSELKQQGMTAFTSLLMGAEGADGMVDQFFDRITTLMFDNLPKLTETLVKMLAKLTTRVIAVLPELVFKIIEELYKINWAEIGWEIIKGIGQGIVNGLAAMVESWINPLIRLINHIPGVDIPELNFGRADFLGSPSVDTINKSSATSQMVADNSTNNYNITMNATGNLDYDAKELYERISIARQTRGTR